MQPAIWKPPTELCRHDLVHFCRDRDRHHCVWDLVLSGWLCSGDRSGHRSSGTLCLSGRVGHHIARQCSFQRIFSGEVPRVAVPPEYAVHYDNWQPFDA